MSDMFLVTTMIRGLEVGGVDVGLPEHVCGLLFVYDDPIIAQSEADKMPGSVVKLIRGVDEKEPDGK